MRRTRWARFAPLGLCALGASLAAQPLGGEFRVNTTTTLMQRVARVGSDPFGNFVVAWGSYQPSTFNFAVFGQRYAKTGAPLGSEFPIGAYTGTQNVAAIAADASGGFVIVWQDSGRDGDGYGVFGQRFTSGGVPLGADFRVNTYTTSFQADPAIASDAAGNFVVVWGSFGQDGALDGIHAQRYDASGTPLGSEFPVNAFTPSSQRFPAVASDSSGNFVVAWESNSNDGSVFGIFARRYAASGGPLGGEFIVNSTTSGNQYEAAVACDSAGNFVVAWASFGQDGSSTGVFGQRYDSSGAARGGEFRVNTYTTFGQALPSVAMSAAGAFVVVWNSNSQDGDLNGVFGQRFGSSGAPLDVEFRVNTTTASNQTADQGAIALDASGNFVVVWSDQALDGSSFGVFGQRVCVPFTNVSISVAGATTVSACGTAGTATVSYQGGGAATYQWAYRDAGSTIHLIMGQTGTAYLVNGADFASPAPPGVYGLFCLVTPTNGCGSLTGSNEIPITVTTGDTTAPVVTPPGAATLTQSLCL